MAPTDSIKHMVVLMMENRSFDHMLGFAQSGNWQIDGIGGAKPNTDSEGNSVRVSDDAVYSGDFPGTLDPGHATFDVLTQLYGNATTPVTTMPTMEGFVRSFEGKTHDPQKAHRVMKCFAPEKLPVLTQLAQQFAVCDRWFSSLPGPTFPNRAFAHGATSIGRVDMGFDWMGMSKTIYELFAQNNLDSRIYYHDSTMAMTFRGLKNQSKYFVDLRGGFWSDCKNDKLPAYSFLEPRYANSQDDDDGSYFSASDQHRALPWMAAAHIEPGVIDHTEYDHTSLIATARKLFLPNWQNTYLTERDRIANTFERNLTRTEPRNEEISILPASLSASISDHLRAHVNMAAQLERELVPQYVQTGMDPNTITTEKAASDYLLKVKQSLAAVAIPAPPASDGGPES